MGFIVFLLMVVSQASNAQLGSSSSSRLRVTSNANLSATQAKMDDLFASEEGGRFSTKRLKLSGSFAMAAMTEQTQDSDSSGFYSRFMTSARYKLLETLDVNTEIALALVSDRTQEVIGDNYSESGIFLRNASLDWAPAPQLFFQAGALKQENAVNSRVLISSNRNFPATLEKITLGSSKASVSLLAQQAIPTSRSLDSERQEKEKMPSFFTEKVTLKLAPNDHFQFMPYYGLFRFKDLPSKVAFEGSTRGNSVQECFASTCTFNYGFEGQVYGGEGLLRINDQFEVIGFYNEVHNNVAPETLNTGREIGVMAQINFKNIGLVPSFTSFFAEADVAPAYYNKGRYGGTNLEGYRTGLEILFTKYKFRLDLQYTSSQVVNPGRNQKNREVLAFGLETFNVEF